MSRKSPKALAPPTKALAPPTKKALALRRYRAQAAARGLCGVCRWRFPRPGVSTCDHCLDTNSARKMKPAARAKVNASRRRRKVSAERVATLKASGRCIQCGRRPPFAGRASCILCLNDSARRTRDYYQRVGR